MPQRWVFCFIPETYSYSPLRANNTSEKEVKQDKQSIKRKRSVKYRRNHYSRTKGFVQQYLEDGFLHNCCKSAVHQYTTLSVEKGTKHSPLTLDIRPHRIFQRFQSLTRQSWKVLMVPYPVPRLDGCNVPIQVKPVRHLKEPLKYFR